MAFRPVAYRNVARVGDFRSGLEATMAKHLTANGAAYEYEKLTIHYTQPETKKRYKPDFKLENGIIVEGKGRFLTDDRQKHKLIKACHPDLDIRFVFSNPRARLNKGSDTTYANWCERYGFQYAHGLVPPEWIREPANAKRLAAIEVASKK